MINANPSGSKQSRKDERRPKCVARGNETLVNRTGSYPVRRTLPPLLKTKVVEEQAHRHHAEVAKDGVLAQFHFGEAPPAVRQRGASQSRATVNRGITRALSLKIKS